ncbi:hypothetical protein CAEBREN_24812 [Caenorhabditis brenneri]|uniref:Uncharacterized protein n=1 Tax=Caenorhabditis brenneri TaxID=135651 RepID=G0PAL3_CAEBE|nr:hypothetical protein CAEBREN_24812 [Caenorhabditis brenneri]
MALLKISKALDTKNIGEVYLALQNLDDDFDLEKCEDSFSAFLNEIITWDLKVSEEISEAVIRHLISLLHNKESLRRICEKILKTQTAVAVQIAVETMIEENWRLSKDDCKEVWNKIEETRKSQKLDEPGMKEFLRRTAANCMILRTSGAPSHSLSRLLFDALTDSNELRYIIPKFFLNEIAIVAPFHPLAVIEDLKNLPNYFIVPCVNSVEYSFRLKVDEFAKFITRSSTYQKQHARSILKVFHHICAEMEKIEPMECEDIDRIVDFWIAAIGIFDGSEVSMDEIGEAAKLVEKTTRRFVLKRQPLFLKRFLRKIHDNEDGNIGLEPQIVATIITTFQRLAFGQRSSEYYEELGEFWTLCMKMKYNDVYLSTVFYSSCFTLAQAQAVFRVKKELCLEVYEKILKPMHQQIVDFVEMKKIEANKEMSDEQRMMMEQANIGATYFSILVCTYQNAEEKIVEFTKS